MDMDEDLMVLRKYHMDPLNYDNFLVTSVENTPINVAEIRFRWRVNFPKMQMASIEKLMSDSDFFTWVEETFQKTDSEHSGDLSVELELAIAKYADDGGIVDKELSRLASEEHLGWHEFFSLDPPSINAVGDTFIEYSGESLSHYMTEYIY